MPVKIIISRSVAGMTLHQDVVAQLYELHPEFFDEPHKLSDLMDVLPNQSEQEKSALLSGAVIRDGDVHFLSMDSRLRTSPWLVTKLESEGSANLVAEARTELKIVEIPDSVEWYVYTDDDGSESVHERHRVWN